MASPSSVLTRGLGSWGETLMVTLGLGSSAVSPVTPTPVNFTDTYEPVQQVGGAFTQTVGVGGSVGSVSVGGTP